MTNTNNATGFLRFNKRINRYCFEDTKKYLEDKFTLSYVYGGYNALEATDLYEKSLEEIYKIVKDVNNYAMKNLYCHVQGIIVFEKEQKAIICFSRKVYLCNICDTAEYVEKFQNILNYRYYGCVDTTSQKLLKYCKLLNFMKDGNPMSDFEKKREVPADEMNYIMEIARLGFNIHHKKNVKESTARIKEILASDISKRVNDFCNFALMK